MSVIYSPLTQETKFFIADTVNRLDNYIKAGNNIITINMNRITAIMLVIESNSLQQRGHKPFIKDETYKGIPIIIDNSLKDGALRLELK